MSRTKLDKDSRGNVACDANKDPASVPSRFDAQVIVSESPERYAGYTRA
jgi:hypothetical protein